MIDYRIRPRSKGWREAKLVCLAVSVGSQSHEGAKLAGTISWINAHFTKVIVDVSDTLQRWNMLNQPGMNMEGAAVISRQNGADWLSRNADLLSSLPACTEIIRWDRWLLDPDYFKTLFQIENLYKESEIFRAAVNTDANNYLLRNPGSVEAVGPERVMHNSRSFIIEECAAHTLLGRSYTCAKIYPGRSLESLSLLRTGNLVGAPHGLENETYVKIDLEKIGDLVSTVSQVGMSYRNVQVAQLKQR